MNSKPAIVLGTLLAMSTAAIAQTATQTPQPLPQPVPQAVAPAPGTVPDASQQAPAPMAAGIIAVQGERQFLSSELIGADVMDATGEQVGDIEDLIFDEAYQLVGVVIATGGFLGIGEHDVGIEIIKLTPSTEPEGFTVALTRAELEAAPAFRTLAAAAAEREAELMRQQQQTQPPLTSPQPAPQQ